MLKSKLPIFVDILKMESAQNILSLALNHPVMPEEMELVQHKTQVIPGTVHYVINRYRKLPNATFEDTGMMIYNFKAEDHKNLSLIHISEPTRRTPISYAV